MSKKINSGIAILRTKGFTLESFSLKNSRGFTLIELLVSISIIGVLSSIVLTSLTSAKQKAVDANLKSADAQIRIALDAYFASNGIYPAPGAASSQYCIGSQDCVLGGVPITDYISLGEKYDDFIASAVNKNNKTGINLWGLSIAYAGDIDDFDFPTTGEFPLIGDSKGFVYTQCNSTVCGESSNASISGVNSDGTYTKTVVGNWSCTGDGCSTSSGGAMVCGTNTTGIGNSPSCTCATGYESYNTGTNSCSLISGGTDCGANTNGGLTTQTGGCTCATGYSVYDASTNSCSAISCRGTFSGTCTESNDACADEYSGFCAYTPATEATCTGPGEESQSCSGLDQASCQSTSGCTPEFDITDPENPVYTGCSGSYGGYACTLDSMGTGCENSTNCTFTGPGGDTCDRTTKDCSYFNTTGGQPACDSFGNGCSWY